MERREVSTRSSRLIRGTAAWLSRTRITPNQISGFSVIAALLVPLGLLYVGGWPGVLAAVLGVQLRLLANVLDGLVAVEGGKASAVGVLYNDIPDRLADAVILVSLGYALGAPTLGWLAALLAVATAYIRLFGGALGLAQSFAGPMAKQHRMALATVLIVLHGLSAHPVAETAAYAGLAILVAGTAWTCVRRTLAIARALNERSGA